jgi:hypothetical protein
VVGPDADQAIIGHQQVPGQGWDAVPAQADGVARMLTELVLARRQPVEPNEGQPAIG